MPGITHDQFISMLQARLGSRTDILAATIVAEAENIRATVLEQGTFHPWFLQGESTSVSTVAATEYVALPTDFLSFEDDDEWSGVSYNSPLISGLDPWVDIHLDDWNIIRQKWQNLLPGDLSSNVTQSDLSGSPQDGGVVGSRLYLRPFPDAIYNLRFRYYKSDSAFTTGGGQNLWLTYASDWAIGEVGFVFASQYVRDPDGAAIFDSLRKEGRRRCYNTTVARREAGKMRQQGDD